MYIALILLSFFAAVGLIADGARKRNAVRIRAGLLVGVGAAGFFALLAFWGEMLWFEAVGYAGRFWIAIGWQAGSAVVGAAVAAGLVWAATRAFTSRDRASAYWAEALGAVGGAVWGLSSWSSLLRWFHRAPAGVEDPILGLDAGFYLFSLPVLDRTAGLIVFLAIVAAARLSLSLVQVLGEGRLKLTDEARSGGTPRSLYLAFGLLLIAFAAVQVVGVFELLYSPSGVVTGPGWTDVYIRLPALALTAVASLAIALLLFVPGARRALDARLARGAMRERFGPAAGLAALAIALGGLWLLVVGVAPALAQWLYVEPNEITRERPYIEHNIAFTRRAFGLEDAEDRPFSAQGRFTSEVMNRNRHVLDEVRLWDWRALNAVYDQFQEIRLYYEFPDVDIDRYHVNGAYREVMVAAREMDQRNLPAGSDTFVNKRFKYTHGYGLTLTAVNEFTDQGLPNLLIKDIPPVAQYASLEVERPEIYYGQLTDSYVVVNSEEPEFDYPSGDENQYVRYAGDGGVALNSLWRKFLYGLRFDGTPFFLSSYPTEDSRLMFRRQVSERVRALAPFLELDPDPYVVLSEGRMYWIVDAYTSSRRFPYSAHYDSLERIEYSAGDGRQTLTTRTAQFLDGANYVRNSVKAVVDAYNGDVRLYVFEPEDPLVQAWSAAYPGLFQPREQMPETLERHVRYPHELLTVQGLIYAKYHMTDPSVFYNQEDLWVRATEKYHAAIQPVEPYYIMWAPPETDQAEFTSILPFTPKNRQVLVGWIAGLCDGENYGRLLVYKFPKEQRVLGPQQMETKIDQDRYLSERLTLWDQRGSNVIRGNVLAIPLDDSLLYVEPIYLQADTAAYPELRLVAVMQGDDLSYAETFDEALRGLIEGEAARPSPTVAAGGAGPAEGPGSQRIQRAAEAFDRYLEMQSRRRFDEAAEALADLEAALSGSDATDKEQ